MELLLLVIPFEDTGAMETFLLNAIANDSAYDAEIIRKGNQFVEEVDKERKYLTKRRYITKSKFDVYFSIRTAAEQFVERQNILKRVPWEQYSQIQEEFQKLKDFGIPGTIGDGDLWLFWCPWWHFIKNRLWKDTTSCIQDVSWYMGNRRCRMGFLFRRKPDGCDQGSSRLWNQFY